MIIKILKSREMAYPYFQAMPKIPSYCIPLTDIHPKRVNPIAPRYMEDEGKA